MRSALIGLAILPFLAGGASAHPLNDAQLDDVTAGASDILLSTFNCPGCAFAVSSSASNNGVTTSTSATGVISPPTPPSPPPSPPPPADNGGASPGFAVAVPPTAVAVLNALSAGATVIH